MNVTTLNKQNVTLGRTINPYTNRFGSTDLFGNIIYSVLANSEWKLISRLIEAGDWIGPQPPSGSTQDGQLEFSVFLYLFHNQDKITDSTLRQCVSDLVDFLNDVFGNLPDTKLDDANYKALAQDNVVDTDGTVYGTGAYEQYDQNWVTAFRNFVACITHGALYENGFLAVPPIGYEPIQATSRTPGTKSIKIGLVSDWGTGCEAARKVITNLVERNPDYILHLGDVYYSGTPATEPFSDLGVGPLGEEQTKLIEQWPQNYEGRSFTLNSNHEMYTGGYGYFGNALKSQIFSAQGGYSMFALQVGDWTVLGLDSAYYSNPLSLYMYGALDPKQIAWIASLGLTPSKTIVMTHHTGFDFDGTLGDSILTHLYYYAFWGQILLAFGGRYPYAWYWGHEHNGIMYKEAFKLPSLFEMSHQGTYCRCLGHGALPFGVATGLSGKNIQWFAQNLNANSTISNGRGPKPLVYNGYVMLEFDIDQSGVCQRITEGFYDYSDQSQPLQGSANTLFSNKTA